MGKTDETSEERAVRKSLKKSKKEIKELNSNEDEEQDENITPSVEKGQKKKRKKEEENEEHLIKKKKTESNSALPHNGDSHNGIDHSNEIPRKRTRSISEHEEIFTPLQIPEEFRKEHQITISGTSDDGKGAFVPPAPMLTFTSTPFSLQIKRAFDSAGFTSPTLTQAQAWPIALSGRDVIAVAKTGSGKTCGFLLPAFHRLLAQSRDMRRGKPGILVLAPTRELACQIEEECVRFGRSSNIRSACAYGGAPKSLQIRKIQGGLDVIIATPGRLNDLLEMGVIQLDFITFLVLDEADRMLDMGFEPQIRSIVEKIPAERQSMMFTATWPREVQKLAREFLRNPIEIRFGDVNHLTANKAIKQIIHVIDESDKLDTLKAILKEINPDGNVDNVPKTIIFVSRKNSCDHLANGLWDMGYSVDSLHGDKQQFMRTKVMDQFKRSSIRILVATDVAARGLDVKDIEVVINYDFPAGQNGVEDYVHRIGRTARAGAEGKAYTFFTRDDSKRAPELIGVLKRAEQEIPDELKKYDRSGFGGGFNMGSGFRGRGRGGFGSGRGWRGGGGSSGGRGFSGQQRRW